MPINRLNSHRIFLMTFTLFYLLGFSIEGRTQINAQLSNGNTVELIGIGMYQELRNDIYIGALFGPQSIADVEELKDANVAKRMSLRFVNEYSNRKLTRHWKERMAMNNPREQWQPLTREIVGFSNLFKRTFVAGDEINIDFVPGVGVQVYLNNTLFNTFKKPEFMEVMLNVWLGNIPPTKAFKSSIRGLDDESTKAGFIAGYSDVTPIKGRFDADLAPPVQVAKVSPPPQPEKEPKPAEKTPPVKVAKQETTKADVKLPVIDPTKIAKVESAAANLPVKSTGTPVKEAVADRTSQTTTNKIDTPSVTAKQNKPAQKIAKITPPPIEEEIIDVDLIAGSYTRDLINAIREHQEYPKKALLEEREGDVTAKVTISLDGEVVDIDIIEQSGSRILDKAVARIIRRSAPFQPIPPELEQKEFVFEVPISFKL